MFPVVVPRLGWTMEEGTFIEWLRRDGDLVQAGEALFLLEGDKAQQEIEASEAGTLHIAPDAPLPGDIVKVGRILGCLTSVGETPDWIAAAPAGIETVSHSASELEPAGIQNRRGGLRAQRVRDDRGAATPSASNVAIALRGPTSERTISPRARRIARELNVDWTNVSGSGRTGRIRECDIRSAHATGGARAPDRPQSSQAGPGDRFQAWTPLRRTIADRLSHSARTTVPVTLTTSADATNLVNLRGQFQAAGSNQAVPTYTDILIKLTASALRQHPELNSHWGDAGLTLFNAVNIGLAVDAPHGLVVPVVRDVIQLGLRELSVRTRTLIDAARRGTLQAEQMRGGTFTVTNLGMLGIDHFTPVINSPECAILGIGRISREPTVVGDQIVPRDRLALSLTFDHRCVDGAPAARFLDALRKAIESPAAWLLN